MNLFKGQDKFNLTEGGIVKPLLCSSLPIVTTNLLQTAYNLADTLWLSQYLTEALAAIPLAFPTVFLLISLGMGLPVAGSVLVVQHTGAEETDKAEHAAPQTVTFMFFGSAMLGAFGYLLVRPFLDFLGISPDVLPGATAYMQIITPSLPFMSGFFVFVSLIRGVGDIITPMLVMFGAVALNVVLDPSFINGWALGPIQLPRLGIQNAAIATVISRVLTAVADIAIMASGSRGIQIHLIDMRPDFRYLQKIPHIGIPASVEGAGHALFINALLIVVGPFLTSIVTAFDIGTRMFLVIFLPATAVARGAETMPGQNIGAGKYDRVEQANYVTAKGLFFILGLFGVAIFLVLEPIISVFTIDAEIFEVGAEFLRYVSLLFGFIGIMRAFSGGFRGAGEILITVVISVVTLVGIRLPVAFVASQGLLPTDFWFLGITNIWGIWTVFFVSNIVGVTTAWFWFRRGAWREGDAHESPVGGELENDDVELSSGPD